MDSDLIDFYKQKYGRDPSFNHFGQLRGFRSRRGAPQSEKDTMPLVGNQVGAPENIFNNGANVMAWNKKFAGANNERQARYQQQALGAPLGGLAGGPQPARPAQLAIPDDALKQQLFADITDQLPGDPPLPPGISLPRFQRDVATSFQNDTGSSGFPKFYAANGTDAYTIENRYRTPGTGRGFVTFKPSQMNLAKVSDLPY